MTDAEVRLATVCPACGSNLWSPGGGMTRTPNGFRWDGAEDATVTCEHGHTFVVTSFQFQRHEAEVALGSRIS